MSKIKIITDNCCDLPKDIIKRNNIEVINHDIICKYKSNTIKTKMECKELYKKLKSGNLEYKISSPSVDKFLGLYSSWDNPILVLTVSSKLSKAYRNANKAKEIYNLEKHDKRIEIIDTLNGSIAQGILVIKAAKLVEEGKNIDEITKTLENVKFGIVHFGALDTVKNAVQSGRVSELKGAILNSINCKTIIQIRDGKVCQVDKAMNEEKSLEILKENIINSSGDISKKVLAISHADCYKKALKLKSLIEMEYKFCEIIISEIGPIFGCNTSPGAILASTI